MKRKWIHELKIWPEFFEAVLRKEKRFEVRFNDREYSVGDTLVLREWVPEDRPNPGYTERYVNALVMYMIRFYGYPEGWSGKKGWYVILDIELTSHGKLSEVKERI